MVGFENPDGAAHVVNDVRRELIGHVLSKGFFSTGRLVPVELAHDGIVDVLENSFRVGESACRLSDLDGEPDANGFSLVELDGRERLFPFRRETVNRIDMKARKIEVSLPPGLLEL